MATVAFPRRNSPPPAPSLTSSPRSGTPVIPPVSSPLVSSLESLEALDLSISPGRFAVASLDFDNSSIHLTAADTQPRIFAGLSSTHLEQLLDQRHFFHVESPAATSAATVTTTTTPAAVMDSSMNEAVVELERQKSPSVSSIIIDSPCSLSSPSDLSSPSPMPPFMSSATVSGLFPPHDYCQVSVVPPIYAISASQLHDALTHAAHQPLPHASQVFPWLHGLHPANEFQLAFLDPTRLHVNSHPSEFRCITLVKLGSLNSCKLRGTVSHKEILPDASSNEEGFLDLDPIQGVGLRNFHIQVAKVATVSDIVVYSKKGQPTDGLLGLAKRISQAQRHHRLKNPNIPEYNTFIVSDPFEKFEDEYPNLVAIGSTGKCHEYAMDFLYHEHKEMSAMSTASEVLSNFYMGNLANISSTRASDSSYLNGDPDVPCWDIYVECLGGSSIPSRQYLQNLDSESFPSSVSQKSDLQSPIVHLEFPSTGSLALGNLSDHDLDSIVNFCDWLYRHAIGNNKKILLFCPDGYTETSLLGLAYVMYATGVTAAQAYIDLHASYNREFFTFPADLVLLNHLQSRMLANSPVHNDYQDGIVPELPSWYMKMDGSLPSKIFSHMYLGNLGHANNPELLRLLGIKRVLSIGETIDWRMPDENVSEHAHECEGGNERMSQSCETMATTLTCNSSLEPVEGFAQLKYIDQIQDDGIDSLSRSIEECLEFIDEGCRLGEPVLVHCRAGVSRSATICIAEVIRRKQLSLPQAYLYVRARRLNVIIQPNLRFMYELMKWEEEESVRRGGSRHKRDMDWALLCKEISSMNKVYIG
ncbi:hypothetical protein V1514DRAFT_342699 [Lipomyces japonicus]|uniref:uncharacterized protein n=1 Tax=Lipomyces japonicus TaxID=56871 RepID=UPI0034CF42A3